MLRPERMSRVSVTGTKAVMPDVVEALHDLGLVHLESYDGRWEGFAPGDPVEGANEASDQLVTVRSIGSILDLEDLETAPARVVEDGYAAELERARERVNELDDRRSELRDQLRAVREARDTAEPFLALGIDLDLLWGYDTLTVRVGEGDEAAVRAALEAAEAVDAFELFAGDGRVAAFAAGPSSAVDEALVGAAFTLVEVPDAEGPPDEYAAELEHEAERLEQRLRTVEEELEELKLEVGRFLLAVEERLTVEVRKAEAPLTFATTEHAFVAEGWLPTDRIAELRSALEAAADDHVELEELEQARYDGEGAPREAETVTDGGQETRMADTGPPVVMDNLAGLSPFELLVRTMNTPRYTEFDPTVLVWLTFPTFFGFMIGDLGYGIFYALVGYLMWSRFDSPGLQSLGGVALWSGFFTMVFGVLYGEVFGLHVLGEFLWGEHGVIMALGHPPIEKGLEASEFALLWLFVAMVVGLLHVGVGYVLGFFNEAAHSLTDAVLEKGSWFLLMFGVWIWILSRHAQSAKPPFIYTLLNEGEEAVFALGFSGFSETAGLGALGVAVVGFLLMAYNEYRHYGGVAGIIAPLEGLNVLVNILSYARLTAVLLAKAGMAFVVNLLVFGLTAEGHFAITHGADEGMALLHGGPAEVVGGLLILVIGHATVWALGITSAGLQAIRLEYVEFFQKFYVGGGEPYEPFGSATGD